MKSSASTDELLTAVFSRWDELIELARKGFTEFGRGVIAINRDDRDSRCDSISVRTEYRVYDFKKGRPDPEAARIIATYDPGFDMIIQFTDEDGNHQIVKYSKGASTSPSESTWYMERPVYIEEFSRFHEQPFWPWQRTEQEDSFS